MSTDDEFARDLPLFATRSPPAARASEVIPVSALNRRVRNLLEANLELMWISGELSNVVRAASGHWYFSLKDEQAQVRCVMFRGRAQTVAFTPENGMQVEVRALPSLYEPRGDFQLGVETMRRAGLGALFEAFERLKARLLAEGLFDPARKRAPPTFSQRIGIVTSTKAAALRDVLTTLQRRAPMIGLVIYPTTVQGASAPTEIAAAIDSARSRREVEVLLIVRGGGSVEDLWAFNDESVARAIQRVRESTEIVVISGVGHETDFTIADFMADVRAPTPTAAAELASPNREDLRAEVTGTAAALRRALERRIDTLQQKLDRAARALISPQERLTRERERVTYLRTRLTRALAATHDRAAHQLALARQRLGAQHPATVRLQLVERLQIQREALQRAYVHMDQQRRGALDSATKSLALLSPLNVLERGYGIVRHRGKIVTDTSTLSITDAISVRVAKGEIGATITTLESTLESAPPTS
jgi:exodeoxyribonuclease VII large subunit